MASFSQAVSSGLHQFMNPSGRSTRSEYWWYMLFLCLVGFVIGLFSLIHEDHRTSDLLARLLFLPFELSGLMAGIRRLHDTDRSGWNVCWALLPVIGWIYLIYLYCQPSDEEENAYGVI